MATESVPVEARVPVEAPVTAAVQVKLPDFWKTDPAMWFAQAESQFVLAGVRNDETKFHHIVTKLDQSVIYLVADLIRQPPATGKFNAIKERLISRLELTMQSKMERLLGSYDLGDLRPTHLLSKMQELATGLAIDDSLLKMLFLQKLPVNIRAVLSINDGSLSKLAEMGDKMMEMDQQTSAIHTAETNLAKSLADEVAALTADLRRLKTQQSERRRSRSNTRNRSNGDKICWYHRKYANRAHRCLSPCNYQQPKN